MSSRRALHVATLCLLAAAAVACGSSASDPSPTPTPTATASLDPPTAPLTTITNQNWGWVAPDPANPRYLQLGGASGQPYAISSYGSLIGCRFSPDQARQLKELGATYAVVWYQWSGCRGDLPDWFAAPWTGPWRLACDPRDASQRDRCPDHPLWDLSQFDEQYWQTLDAMLTAAENDGDGSGKKLVVRVHLFARQEFGVGRETNPFRGGNNVNGVRAFDGAANRDPDLRYFVRSTSSCAQQPCEEPAHSLFVYQQAYVRKLLDTTHGHGNVVYELMNEPPPSPDDTSEFTFFARYWSWFVKDHLASHYGVARLVSQDEQNDAFAIPDIDVGDARWSGGDVSDSDSQFLSDLSALTAAIRNSYLSNAKPTALDEFGNAAQDATRLRLQAWSIVTSGGHFHLEDPCDPGFRACPWGDGGALLDAQPWVPVRSIEAFKAASRWRFDRAHPVHSDDSDAVRWFYWMVQDGPPDTVGSAVGGTDHVGYLAHHDRRTCTSQPLSSDLPRVPEGATEFVARLWNPAGTDYLKDATGRPFEHHLKWGGGAFDWCQTPLRDAILGASDVVVHVHAGS